MTTHLTSKVKVLVNEFKVNSDIFLIEFESSFIKSICLKMCQIRVAIGNMLTS